MHHCSGRQAIVLGGSMAGLLAARALSEHFERVTILERDALSDEALPRAGVPQGRHTHGLLAGGLQALEAFFPGIGGDLVNRGAVMGDLLGGSHWVVNGGSHIQFESGLIGTCQSRPLLEQVVRRRVAMLPNVVIRDQVRVMRLVSDAARQQIIGVAITDRRDGSEQTLVADLVVDASGRNSHMPEWLESLGYLPPSEERVEIDLSYATRTFRRLPGQLGESLAVVVTQTAQNMRFGVALGVEGDLWSVTLGGMCDDVPTNDAGAFVEFSRGLASSLLHNFLQDAEPVSEVKLYKYPASLRRRYERLRRFPEGLLVLGDALCSFSPVYGQGMTVAAMQARKLQDCLHRGLRGLARRFFREAARIVDVAWQISVTADFRYPHVRGPRPWSAGLINNYLDLVHRAARTDREVALAFHRVANLLERPASLFRPTIVMRILKSVVCDAFARDQAVPEIRRVCPVE